MGRGLSELQRFILRRAGQVRRVYYADVLEGYFGWVPRQPIKRHGTTRNARYPATGMEQTPPEQVGELASPGRPHFSRSSIGDATYRKAMASLSRACLRLGKRGLVTCLTGNVSRWAGVEITDQGREWLSVN